MIQWRTTEEAMKGRIALPQPNGTVVHRSQYIGTPVKEVADPPQGFLVEQDPHSVIDPHFHAVNQFQVIISGGGRLGTHAVTALSVHYAGKYTAYGPIVAGDEGVWYFTLRDQSDPGAQYLPGARDRLKPGPRVFHLADDVATSTPAALRARTAPTADVLLDKERGLKAGVLRLGPGQSMDGPDPVTGNGQYYVVVAGTLLHAGSVLTPKSCLWVGREDGALTVVAGSDGLEVLVLQFPLH